MLLTDIEKNMWKINIIEEKIEEACSRIRKRLS